MEFSKSIILILLIFNANANMYIHRWEKKEFNSQSELKQTLEANKCTPLKKQIIFFKERNKLISLNFPMKGAKTQVCFENKRYSDEELMVSKWEKVKLKKDENISSLIKNSGCKDIFTKQIPEFEKRNQLHNSDLIPLGKEVEIQSCLVENTKVAEIIENKPIKKEIRPLYKNMISLGYNAAIFSMIDYREKGIMFKLTSSEKELNLSLSKAIFLSSNFDLFVGVLNKNLETSSFNIGLNMNIENVNYNMSYSQRNLITNFHYKLWKESGLFLYTKYSKNDRIFYPGLFFTF